MINEQVIVAGTFRLPLDQADAIRPHLEAVIKATHQEAGCLEYCYAPDVMEPGLWRVFEIWSDRAAHLAHLETPHMKAWIEARLAHGFHDREITVYSIASQQEA